MTESPSFDDAVEFLRNYVSDHGYSQDIKWVWRDTVIGIRVKQRLAHDPEVVVYLDFSRLACESDVREFYTSSAALGLGIELSVMCVVGDTPFCYVFAPQDKIESEQTMVSALKCSIPARRVSGILIRRPWLAWLVRIFYGRPLNYGFADEVHDLPTGSKLNPGQP